METETQKAYKATVGQINEILKYDDDLRKVFSVGAIQNIKKAMNILVRDLDKVLRDEAVTPSPDDRALIKATVNDFLNIAIERPICLIFRDLAAAYLLLVFNWSQAVGRQADIERDIKIVDGLIRAELSLLDTIYVLQQLLDRARKLQRYEPPAFELSRAYLDNLKKHLEETKAANPN